MRHAQIGMLVGLVLFGTGTSALATITTPSLAYPGAPQPVYDGAQAPYAMTYTEEVARNLGIQNGRMDLFSVHPDSGYLPTVSGGMSGNGAMFRLQWHPGE